MHCSALHDLQKPSIVCTLALVSVFFKWSETKMWKNCKGVLSVSTYSAHYFIIAIIYKVPFCKTVWCNAYQKICGKQHSPKRLTLIGNSFWTLIWGSFNLFFLIRANEQIVFLKQVLPSQLKWTLRQLGRFYLTCKKNHSLPNWSKWKTCPTLYYIPKFSWPNDVTALFVAWELRLKPHKEHMSFIFFFGLLVCLFVAFFQ